MRGNARPLAIWNNTLRPDLVGASSYVDGEPKPDPALAPSVFLYLPFGDPVYLPTGAEVMFQAVLQDPGSVSPKRFSTTNSAVLEAR